MSAIDRVIFAGNLIASLVACFVNVRSARRGLPPMRPIRIVTACLAAVYASGYVVVLVGQLAPAEWSALFRPLALATWPLVWMFPALLSDRIWIGVQRGVDQLAHDTRTEDAPAPPRR